MTMKKLEAVAVAVVVTWKSAWRRGAAGNDDDDEDKMSNIKRAITKRFSVMNKDKSDADKPSTVSTKPETAHEDEPSTGAGAGVAGVPASQSETAHGTNGSANGDAGYQPPKRSASTLSAALDAFRNKEALDDRKFLLEHGLMIISNMSDGGLKSSLQDGAIKLLYNDLPHPAYSYLGEKYQFRTADGSYNNIDIPHMGAANTPYSRSVQQTVPLNPRDLPDAGLVFDTLLRREHFKPHPGGLNSLMFAFAALVIHTVFQTSHENVSMNETSSYVDLAPLYGDIQEDQDKLRPRDGFGLLFNDVFSEDRLMLLPPACCVILVCFSRNHNYIARKIYEINERGTYKDPKDLTAEQVKAQDEEIFQTARACNIGWFGNVVFSDYFSAILGLTRFGNTWVLNPFGEIRNDDHTLFERGRGNVVSVEFNCLYRWHATTSAEDEKWVEATFANLFKKPSDDITIADFKRVFAEIKASEPDIQHWTFGGMQRDETGKFNDADLAKILHNATEHPAGSFGARHTPHAMRLHEIMGIEANRKWGVCGMNAFRRFLGLKPYANFREWNPDPRVADAAEKLYGDIERLELYVGLQAEETKPVMDGAGLCPGYTVSRAILSDAIALTRGDRFFTQDFTPHNLTQWGFADCQRDADGAGFGSMLGRLFLRTIPEHFETDNTYTWFPLMTPASMETHCSNIKNCDKYTFDRPTAKNPVTIVNDPTAAHTILSDMVGFERPEEKRADELFEGKGFFIATQDQDSKTKFLSAIAASKASVGQFFFEKAQAAIKEKSFPNVAGTTMTVDIVREVFRTVPLAWAAIEVAGIPEKELPGLFDVVGRIYSYVFFDGEADKNLKAKTAAKKDVDHLLSFVKPSLTRKLTTLLSHPGSSTHQKIENAIADLKLDDHERANCLIALMVAMAEMTVVLTNAFYVAVTQGVTTGIPETLGPNATPEGISTFALEAHRIAPPFRGVHRHAFKDITVGPHSLKAGDKIFIDLAAISHNPEVAPEPQAINLGRGKSMFAGSQGVYSFLGHDLAMTIVSETLKAVFSHPGMRVAPGRSALLNRYIETSGRDLYYAYVDRNTSLPVPWPSNLLVQYNV